MKFFAILGIFLLVPVATNAQVIISEIFYNAEGGDDGKEWVEIVNTGTESVPITTWRFTEADINHKIKSIVGGDELSAGEYAVIVDDVVGFQELFPSHGGMILDSSFSLSNTGEVLMLRNADLVDQDSVLYSKEWGANGDGNSLQLSGGEWVAGSPTPGKGGNQSVVTSDNPSDTVDEETAPDETDTETQSAVVTPIAPPSLPKITAYAGERNRKGVVGGPLSFEGLAVGLKDELIPNARFAWTFGDGGMVEGKKASHAYFFPGEYITLLNVSSGEYTGSDRIHVTIAPADIVISGVETGEDGHIAINNQTSIEIDLSGWMIRSKSGHFTIPEGTVIGKNKTIHFPEQIVKLKNIKSKQVRLEYPNGGLVHEYTETNVLSAESEVLLVSEPLVVQVVQEPKPAQQVTEVVSPTIKKASVSERGVTSIEKEKVLSNTKNIPSVANIQASVGALLAKKNTSKQALEWWWYVGVVCITLLGIVAYISARDRDEEMAENYTIIEEE